VGGKKALFLYVGSRGNFDLSDPVCVMAVLLSGAEWLQGCLVIFYLVIVLMIVLITVIIKHNSSQWHIIINEDENKDEDGRLQQGRAPISNFSGQRYAFYGDFRLKCGS